MFRIMATCNGAFGRGNIVEFVEKVLFGSLHPIDNLPDYNLYAKTS